MPRVLCTLSLWFSLLLSAPVGAEPGNAWWQGEFAFSTGFNYATGDYDEPVDTDLIYVPATFSYLLEDFPLTTYPWDQIELRVTVPFLAIDGPADFFSDAPTTGSRSDSGLGDVLVRASYIWLPRVSSPLPVFEFKAQVKIPTADASKNLGTGSTDGQLEFDVSKRFGALSPFLSVGYRFVGNAKQLGLNSFVFTTVGASLRVHRVLLLGLDYDYAQASASNRGASHELVPFASLRLSRHFTFGPYATFGLAGYAPDYGGGFSIRYALPVRRSAGFTR